MTVERINTKGNVELPFDLLEVADNWHQLLPDERKQTLNQLKKEMRNAAKELDFETAAQIRDLIKNLEKE